MNQSLVDPASSLLEGQTPAGRARSQLCIMVLKQGNCPTAISMQQSRSGDAVGKTMDKHMRTCILHQDNTGETPSPQHPDTAVTWTLWYPSSTPFLASKRPL